MHVIGVDLGGTNIKAGVLDGDGNLLCSVSIETEAQHGPPHVLERMALAADMVRQKAGLEWADVPVIGAAAPGPLDGKDGVVLETPNMPGWKNIPVVATMERLIGNGVKVFLENDANAAAYAEYWNGAGKGVSCMIQLTLGTGVGGGIVMNGHVWRGIDYCAAELGHMTIELNGRKCGCGNRGCIEAYGSATALVEFTRQKLDSGRASILKDKLAAGEKLTARLVADAAKAGDELSLEVYREVGGYLGTAIASYINIFNPEKVVLSGGMALAGDILFGPIRDEVRRRTWPPAVDRAEIVPALLGNDAGLIGAAGCAIEQMQQRAAGD